MAEQRWGARMSDGRSLTVNLSSGLTWGGRVVQGLERLRDFSRSGNDISESGEGERSLAMMVMLVVLQKY